MHSARCCRAGCAAICRRLKEIYAAVESRNPIPSASRPLRKVQPLNHHSRRGPGPNLAFAPGGPLRKRLVGLPLLKNIEVNEKKKPLQKCCIATPQKKVCS